MTRLSVQPLVDGALSAAITGQIEARTVVCIVSGGNINLVKLAEILEGGDG